MRRGNRTETAWIVMLTVLTCAVTSSVQAQTLPGGLPEALGRSVTARLNPVQRPDQADAQLPVLYPELRQARSLQDQYVAIVGNRGILGSSSSEDADEDGVPAYDDCDERNSRIRTGAVEVSDPAGDDEDCDPLTFSQMGWPDDRDGDGFVDMRIFQIARNGDGTPLAIIRGADCNDDERTQHPLATEVPDGIDNDCDGQTDEPPSESSRSRYLAPQAVIRPSDAAKQYSDRAN